MGLSKIVRLVALLVAVVAAFVDLPEEAAIVALAGVIGGYFIEEDYASRFLIGALALAMVNGALLPIWGIGPYLTAVLGSISMLFNAAACTVIVMGMYHRLKP
jgi:hypothetical protein